MNDGVLGSATGVAFREVLLSCKFRGFATVEVAVRVETTGPTKPGKWQWVANIWRRIRLRPRVAQAHRPSMDHDNPTSNGSQKTRTAHTGARCCQLIHTGGIDHVAVHHSNEIVQAEHALGVRPWVKYWMHGAWLTMGGAKIAKSGGSAEPR